MASVFSAALEYGDELVDLVNAVRSYHEHGDQPRFAGDLAAVVVKLIDQATDGKASTRIDIVFGE